MHSFAAGERRIAPGLAYSLPFAIYIAFLVVESMAGRFAAGSAFDLRWLYALKTICVASALALLWRHYPELALKHWPNARGVVLAVAAGLVVFVVWINLTMPWASLGEGKGFDPRDGAGKLDLVLVCFRVIGAALTVPLMEELFWRSFILRWIERPAFLSVSPRAVGLRALLVSSVLFGFEHGLWLAGIVAGLVYGWLYMRTSNLWVPVIAHAVTNGALSFYVLRTQAWHFW